MGVNRADDSAFIAEFQRIGATEMSKQGWGGLRTVFKRRAAIENRTGRKIYSPVYKGTPKYVNEKPLGLIHREVKDGVVIVGSDSHYWPGRVPVAHLAMIEVAKSFGEELKLLIKNGDEFDGATISRHTTIGWENRPPVVEELATVAERHRELEAAAPYAEKVWPIGNHDMRFETKIATQAPELARVKGVHLRDHFPDWTPCWSVWINDSVVVKHRWHNGVHATYNNTLKSGKTIVTGHLHALQVRPWTDLNGTRYGVDCGCIADTWGPQFENYLENNPRNWRSGFAVLTFVNGRLLPPETAEVIGPGEVAFRGSIISAKETSHEAYGLRSRASRKRPRVRAKRTAVRASRIRRSDAHRNLR